MNKRSNRLQFNGRFAFKTASPTYVPMVNAEAKNVERLQGVEFVARLIMSREGVLLTEVYEGGPLTPDNPILQDLDNASKWRIFGQALIGVDNIHSKGLIHRDLKGPNIVLTQGKESPEPRVIDLALAQILGSRVTHGGTPIYDPPEYQMGMPEVYAASKDAFSMGVVALETFLGHTPSWFSATSPAERRKIMLKELKGLKRLLEQYPDIPQEIRSAILILLDPKPENRNMAAAIELIHAGVGKLKEEE